MPLAERTKVMFLEAFEEMLKTKSTDKIRIKELCARCGTTPQVFYYHFQDKYDLIAWTFLYDFVGSADEEPPTNSIDAFTAAFRRMRLREEYYKKVFSHSALGSISNYVIRFSQQLAKKCVKMLHGTDELTDEQLTELIFFSYGMMGTLSNWISGGSHHSEEELTAYHYSKLPDFLKPDADCFPFPREELLQMAGKQH